MSKDVGLSWANVSNVFNTFMDVFVASHSHRVYDFLPFYSTRLPFYNAKLQAKVLPDLEQVVGLHPQSLAAL